MLIRPATHAGSWYLADHSKLESQVGGLLKKALSQRGNAPGARFYIGPHAGYAYAGRKLAETYAALDAEKIKRVFLLGPSHHVYFRSKVLVTKYRAYETPLGNLNVDTAVCKDLCRKHPSVFGYMSEEVDDDEHLFEMHAPFLVHAAADVKFVPIMILGLSLDLRESVVELLLPYMDESTAFVVLSDFCHWGRRFGYTKYVPGSDISEIELVPGKGTNSIAESIEVLDSHAFKNIHSLETWDAYIAWTGNTICGQKPIGVVLRLIEEAGIAGSWVHSGFDRSSSPKSLADLSVSYASAFFASANEANERSELAEIGLKRNGI